MQDLLDGTAAAGQLTNSPAAAESLTAKQRAAFAAAGRALLDGCLSHLEDEEQAAFWSAIRLCYNRPYSPPEPMVPEIGSVVLPVADIPVPADIGPPLA
ncbi:hypothetical protein [Methylobacterium oryzisoli]|uniref:hypothetical protein n=1 Tax=Methylobacterium oryzisoli TaxID=3385502 RepID=UPI00389291E6